MYGYCTVFQVSSGYHPFIANLKQIFNYLKSCCFRYRVVRATLLRRDERGVKTSAYEYFGSKIMRSHCHSLLPHTVSLVHPAIHFHEQFSCACGVTALNFAAGRVAEKVIALRVYYSG